MKKVFALVLTLALLLAGLPPLHAQTEQHAELNVSFKPVENLDGNVVLEIDITAAPSRRWTCWNSATKTS